MKKTLEKEIAKIPARVSRGIKWLDKNEDKWWDKISLVDLNMESGFSCILGQLYGDFWLVVSGYKGPDISRSYAVRLGLADPLILAESGFEVGPKYYAKLTHEWKRKIKKRRKKTA